MNNNSPQPPPLPNRDAGHEDPEIRRLVILWGVCCMSPIMYLAVAALLRQSFMENSGGYFPFPDDLWPKILIGLGAWVIALQILHFLIKRHFKRRLSQATGVSFVQILSRRTIILMIFSELAVFSGFCLFVMQGDLIPVFGSGIAAMLLYAQSHPRSGLPDNASQTSPPSV